MFIPNSKGTYQKVTGRDIHSRPTYSAAMICPFSPVNMLIADQKTSVRTDSSASRGAADERVATRAKILVPPFVALSFGDKFMFDDMDFRVTAVHKRRNVFGALDHLEIDLEIEP